MILAAREPNPDAGGQILPDLPRRPGSGFCGAKFRPFVDRMPPFPAKVCRKAAVAPVLACCLALSGCAGFFGGASAEEYFAIGMAYFEIGQSRAANRERYFQEAEKWLERARARDRTMSASTYNLGLLNFEIGRFEDAMRYFKAVLARDPENTFALRAAAYTSIRLGRLEEADELYGRFLALVPESADDGYNHALVLFAMERYAEAQEVLERNRLALFENADFLLLFARVRHRQEQPEAIDSYASWLTQYADAEGSTPVARVRFEYAEALERWEQYAKAVEELRRALEELRPGETNPSRQRLRFSLARLLLIADQNNPEGLAGMREAVQEGFSDFDAIEALAKDPKIRAEDRDKLTAIATEGRRAAQTVEVKEPEPEPEDGE